MSSSDNSQEVQNRLCTSRMRQQLTELLVRKQGRLPNLKDVPSTAICTAQVALTDGHNHFGFRYTHCTYSLCPSIYVPFWAATWVSCTVPFDSVSDLLILFHYVQLIRT